MPELEWAATRSTGEGEAELRAREGALNRLRASRAAYAHPLRIQRHELLVLEELCGDLAELTVEAVGLGSECPCVSDIEESGLSFLPIMRTYQSGDARW